ncbi:MAG: HAMP domain-containing sensor histidine kinase [Actinomycetota bacterium]|nr:HAMP domain-containing sensor histidine kinase [Actinomycetota bacterium]
MRGFFRSAVSLMRRRPDHATRVAAATAAIVAVLFSIASATFDVVDGQHRVQQVDARLRGQLALMALNPAGPSAAEQAESDVDSAPVFLWRVGASGAPVPLQAETPHLAAGTWSPSSHPTTATLNHSTFRFVGMRAGTGWLVAGQSLAEAQNIEQELQTAEAIGGTIFVVVVFAGALVIGLRASRPIEEARRRQLEFTADASHELRTPLTVIEAELSLARSGPDSGARDALERVGAESARLRRIVEDLLWLARFDSHPPAPRAEVIDLISLAEVCTERFDALARSYRVDLSFSHDATGPVCASAPPDSIDRLLGVLVDNACRYAGEGGTVRLGVTPTRGGRAAIVVEDSGPGIAPAERARLFDRFHRATDQGSGAGLGLAIADSVVRSTGGRWKIGDSPLGGARMEVSWHQIRLRSGVPPAVNDPRPDGRHPEAPSGAQRLSAAEQSQRAGVAAPRGRRAGRTGRRG